jgi:hypothetical protein
MILFYSLTIVNSNVFVDKFENIKNNRILTKSEFIDSIYTDLVGFE